MLELVAIASWTYHGLTNLCCAGAPIGAALGGALGNLTDRELCRVWRHVRTGVRGLQPALNHDVARAIRTAQIQALELLLDDFAAEDRLAPFLPIAHRFCDGALSRCAPNAPEPPSVGNNPHRLIDEAMAEPETDGSGATRARALTAGIAQALLDELEHELAAGRFPVTLPPAFVALVLPDAAGHSRLVARFGEKLTQQINDNAAFRHILTYGQLSRIEHMGANVEALLRGVSQQVSDLTAITQDGFAQLRREIARDKGLDPARLRPMFDHLGMDNLSEAEMVEKVEEGIAALIGRAAQPVPASNAGADIAATIDAARARMKVVDSAGALALLSERIAEEDAARRQRLLPLLEEQVFVQRATYDRPGAIATLTRIAELDPDRPWAWFNIGDLQVEAGSLREAETAYRAGAAAAQRLLAADPDNAGWQRDLSVSHNRIGDVRQAQGDLAAALTSYRAGLAIAERLAQADPGNAGWQRDLSVSHEKIGDVRQAQGDLAAALTSYRASLAIRERLAQADPGNAGWQRDLSVSHNKIGDAQQAQGDLAAALTSYRADLSIAERLAQADPDNAGWQRDLSVSHNKIGDVRQAQGDLAAALTSYRASLAIRERLAQADPGNAGWQRDVAISHGRVAMIEGRQGNGDKALTAFRQGRDIIAAVLQRSPDNATLPRDLAWFDRQIAIHGR